MTPLPSKQMRQWTIKEAWANKNIVEAVRKSKARTTQEYRFVYSRLHCDQCTPFGSITVAIGDDNYYNACLGDKWFDTEFIAGFVSLVAHDAHLDPPPFIQEHVRVKQILCPFPQAEVLPHNVLSYDTAITNFLLVSYNNDHFAVLNFTLHERTVSVFDGLNYKIDLWKNHIIHTLREYGLVQLNSAPKVKYSSTLNAGEKKQRLEIMFGSEAPWVVCNSNFIRQKNGHNCGPIACTKVLEVFGYIKASTMSQIETNRGGFRHFVMNKYAELISKYDSSLFVETRMTVDDLGKNVINEQDTESECKKKQEDICFCSNSATELVHILTCCGKSVHHQCLLDYIRTMPFCMFCSTSLLMLPTSINEDAIGMKAANASVPIVGSVKNEIETTAAEELDTLPSERMLDCVTTDTTSKDLIPSMQMLEESCLEPPPHEEVYANPPTTTLTKEESICQTPPNEDECNTVNGDNIEDINRRVAREKKNKMQTENARKAVKQRGDTLIADGLGPGAVLTLKVDYRTHSHAAGLVVIVYKSNDTGAALVCCENGVITHDGSAGDYWVPSDRFVVNAGYKETAVIPPKLQLLRDAILKGEYDYQSQPRISYSKRHADITGASSPCKKAICSCKGACTARCGCRRKKLDCTSACGCSGNCNWRMAGNNK